jgi:hypothetical protein
MRNKYTLLIIALLALRVTSIAQQKVVHVEILPMYNESQLVLNKALVPLNQGLDSIIITTFKCYISSVQLLYNGKVVHSKPTNSYYLLNAADGALKFDITVPKLLHYNSIQFAVGIDSATNYGGVKTGCLDPLNGMYWTWHSGYINFKIEGINSQCPTRGYVFQFHVGGYRQPYNSLQNIKLPFASKHITIGIDIAAFLKTIDLTTEHTVMTPGLQAQVMSKRFANSIKPQHP